MSIDNDDDDDTLWKDAVTISLLAANVHDNTVGTTENPDIKLQVVGTEMSPPTLFVRTTPNRRLLQQRSNSDSTMTGGHLDLADIVVPVLHHLWSRRPTLRRYSFSELEFLGAIWIGRTTTTMLQTTSNPKNTKKRKQDRIQMKFQRHVIAGLKPGTGTQSNVYDYSDRNITNCNYIDATIRIHADPSRFPVEMWLGKNLSIRDFIVVNEMETIGLVIVNKAGGIPSHPTVDNSVENVLCIVKKTLNQPRISCINKYLSTVPYRLDVDTSGLQMVCTATFASYYGKLLEAKSRGHSSLACQDESTTNGSLDLRKRYRCLVCIYDRHHLNQSEEDSETNSVNCQTQCQRLRRLCESEAVITHYMDKNDRSAPKKFFDRIPPTDQRNQKTWLDCRLKILRVGPLIRVSNGLNEKEHMSCSFSDITSSLWNNEKYRPPSTTHVVELEIELLTGRTHQIRGQLGAIGHPIVGDTLYGGTLQSLKGGSKRNFNSLALQCSAIDFPRPCIGQKQGSNSSKKKNKTMLVPSEEIMRCRLGEAWWTEVVRQGSSKA